TVSCLQASAPRRGPIIAVLVDARVLPLDHRTRLARVRLSTACPGAAVRPSGGENANTGCAGGCEPAEAPRCESVPHGRDQQQQPHRIADQTWQNEEDGSEEGE